jgi:hypothetical protein
MRCEGCIPFLVALLLVAGVGRAQQIPKSIAEAEAEGAALPRDPAPAILPAGYTAFFGSVERRCVSLADRVVVTSWRASTSMRSGEMILRGIEPTGGEPGNKMLWMPLHDPENRPTTLLIRGVRLDHPSDTIRQSAPQQGVARQVGHPNSFGFPSTVEFPSAGRWLMVVNEGSDWGCFLLDVTDRAARTKPSR